jgi:cyclic pyranopterin phosphate synthase
MPTDLTHLDEQGRARMVDVSAKPATLREAEAAGRLSLSGEAFEALRQGRIAKGDALAVARVAGIQAAKRTAEWIPLCHPVPLHQILIELTLDKSGPAVEVRATCRARAVTGVEMEALVAVTAASLALYDMIKGVDRAACIGPIGVVRKSGGRRGGFSRPWPPEGEAPGGTTASR